MKKIVFDVGANNGDTCHRFSEDSLTTVYAFEPTPYLLKRFLYQKQKENYIVVPYAITDFDGEAIFNIAGQCDWGCSSIHEFEDNLEITWPGRTDFKVTEKIKVQTQRMDTFIKNNNIQQVNYLHCDTQGNDLNVLKSFGEYIKIVESGVVEAANQNPLYKNVDNSVNSITNFLEKNNFVIINMSENDPYRNEINIEFKKKY